AAQQHVDLSPQAERREYRSQTRLLSPQPGAEKNSAGGWLELTVRDDGFGIAAGQTQGFGLRGMQERVQALGGDFTIESGNGCGTCVRIVIPLRSRSNGSARTADQVGNSS